MRIHFILAFLICIFISITSPAFATTAPSTETIIPDGGIYKKIASLKIKDVQKFVGRKLTIKEKISFLALKHKIKHPSKNNKGKGQTAFVFGIVGLALLVAGLFIPYILLGSLAAAIVAIVIGSGASKQDPSDRKAHAGKLMGWITLGLIGLLLILAAIIVGSSI